MSMYIINGTFGSECENFLSAQFNFKGFEMLFKLEFS